MLDHESSIASFVDQFFNAANRNDGDAFAMAFTEDADFTNVFGEVATGRQAIQQFHAPLFSEPRQPGMPSFVHARLENLESRVRLLRPDIATVDVRWKQTGAIAPDGRPWGTRLGLMSLVLVREEGTWAIAVMHNMDLHNMDLPPHPQQ